MDKKYWYIIAAAVVVVFILVYWFTQKESGMPTKSLPADSPEISEEAFSPAAEGASRAASPLEGVTTNPYENVKFNPFE